MNPSSFREYDIRGVADRDLPDTVARAIGTAIGERARGGSVVVGRDCRLHSPRLFAALTDGVRVHAEVIDIGIVPTPVLYFAQQHLLPAAAIVITGSHNPPEDNGFKIMIGAETLYGAAIVELRDRVARLLAEQTRSPTPDGDRLNKRQRLEAARELEADCTIGAGAGFGKYTREVSEQRRGLHSMRSQDAGGAYLDRAISELRLGQRRPKVVVDAGNGSGGPTAVALYTRLGFDVVPLHCEFDGRFPNHHPDPTQPENLAELITTVRATGAELGIALDGDADRVGAVDATGRILWGDQLMILFGKAILAENPGACFVGEVKCSQAMYDELAAAGGHVDMWKVGHSLIKARMKEVGAHLAGEMSGHMFFAHRWLGFDDGIYAGARLLELLSRQSRTLAELAAKLPPTINTPELRVDCPDDQKFAVVARVTEALRRDPEVLRVIDIDGARATFDGGWGLVRASNTQPALVMRCEAVTASRLVQIRGVIEEHIAAARRRS